MQLFRQREVAGVTPYRPNETLITPPTLIASVLPLPALVIGQDSQRIQYSINDSWILYKPTTEKPARANDRRFGTKVNENTNSDPVTLARDYGSFRAVKITTFLTVDARAPLTIGFVPATEKALQNGIESSKKL